MATNFTGQDAGVFGLNGVLDEVMRRRKLREIQQQQTNLLQMQQAGATDRTRLEQQGLTDRTNAIQGGLTTRDANNPAPRDPVADRIAIYKGQQEYDKEHRIGKFAPKEPKGDKAGAGKEKSIDAAVNHRLKQYANYVENQRLGESTPVLDPLGKPVLNPDGTPMTKVRAHHADAIPVPTIAGEPIPQDQWQRVAEMAIHLGISDQAAAERAYATDFGDQVGREVGVDPQSMQFDVQQLKALPSMKGRNVDIPNIGGKTNIYGLAALATKGGWSPQEISDLVHEYTNPQAAAPTEQRLVNPFGR